MCLCLSVCLYIYVWHCEPFDNASVPSYLSAVYVPLSSSCCVLTAKSSHSCLCDFVIMLTPASRTLAHMSWSYWWTNDSSFSFKGPFVRYLPIRYAAEWCFVVIFTVKLVNWMSFCAGLYARLHMTSSRPTWTCSTRKRRHPYSRGSNCCPIADIGAATHTKCCPNSDDVHYCYRSCTTFMPLTCQICWWI